MYVRSILLESKGGGALPQGYLCLFCILCTIGSLERMWMGLLDPLFLALRATEGLRIAAKLGS